MRGLKLTEDRVLVTPIEAEAVTPAGVVLPNPDKDQLVCRAKVVAIGVGKHKDVPGGYEITDPPCDVGDVILHYKMAGLRFELDGEKLILLRGDEVLMIEGTTEKK